MQRIKKLIALVLLFSLLFGQALPVRASEIIAPPPPPSAPTPPKAPEAPLAPHVPEIHVPNPPKPPTPPSAPTPPKAPVIKDVLNKNPEPKATVVSDPLPLKNTSPTGSIAQNTSLPKTGGNVGDTTIVTGSATSALGVTTVGDKNTSLTCSSCGSGAVSITNSQNGTGSTNSASGSVANNTTALQSNTASVQNNLAGATVTGNNNASQNVGTSTIRTGDANISGTAVTALNTNLAGVSVAEFNVADDQRGDLVLNFAKNCVSGCAGANGTLTNTGNGATSTNNASLATANNSTTFQTNEAGVGNNLVLSAASGTNNANQNTGGASTITTGNANVAANSLTFANNNLAGNVQYGVVNIYGTLRGDIVLPDSQVQAPSASLANTGNGTGSTNTVAQTTNTNNALLQTNGATINNNLVLDANTGMNKTSANTDGTSTVVTGGSNVKTNVVNVANSNIAGKTWWLVIVNQAGKWIGKILGSPDGATMAGSQGTEFTVDQNGAITANLGNGAGSTNTVSQTNTTNNTLIQSNQAVVNNTLRLSANTGNNSASQNTGGASTIKTGDANIIANLVNFVNNNIAGNGKLIVTVVNVFGKWFGDFVAPGEHKQQQNPAVAATPQQNTAGVGGPVANMSSSPVNHVPVQNSSSQTTAASTTNTPSSPIVLAANQGVTSGSNQQVWVAFNTSPEVKVKAATTNQPTQSVLSEKVKKEVNINLAWLLLALPVLSLWVLRRKLAPSVRWLTDLRGRNS